MTIFFIACEDYPVYSGYLNNHEKLSLSCINLKTFDPKLTTALEKSLTLYNTKTCKYQLTGYIHHVDSCSNPQVKSLGADFNGYVRLEIRDENKTIYRVQSDFKSEEEKALYRVIKKIKKELFVAI
jgi:hypothetical protein